jgi:sialidase-1
LRILTTMDSRLVLATALVLVGLILAPSAASAQPAGGATETAQVVGSPDIELAASDNRLRTGTTQTVTVQVANSGDISRAGPSDLERRVTTARNVRFEVDDRRLPDGLEVRSGPVLAGSVPEGGAQPISFTFDVSDELDAGSYRLPVTVSYDFTRLAERTAGGQTRYRDFSTDETEYVTLIVEDDARFSVEAVRSEVIAGDSADYVLRVENTGTATARNPRVALSADQTGVFFGSLGAGQPTKTVGVADALAPGEATRFSVTAAAESGVTPASYPVDATVRYETTGGVTRESVPSTVSLAVGSEQEFSVEDIESGLRVAEDGNLRGMVRNKGPRNVTNAVVIFDPESDNVNPRETEYAVGDLSVGDTARFDYRVAVSSEAEGGPRRSSVVVEYRDAEGDRRTSEPVDVSYDVADERDEFSLASDVSLAAGSSTVAEVEVTNVKGETLRNIQARMFTDDPLSDGGSESYVQSLEPGETTTVSFDLSAGGGATPKTYAATVDFRYDDSENESQISDTYRVPVEVSAPSGGGGGPPVLPIAVLLVVAVAWWKRDALRGAIAR